MSKGLKIGLIMLGVLIILGIIIYSKLFILGTNRYDYIEIDKVTISDKDITIKGDIVDSVHSFKDYSYTLVGGELYVEITSVLTSGKYKSGKFEIVIPLTNVNNIHLTDNKSTKVIFSQ